MDDPSIAPAEHHEALRGLARLNRLSRSADILWPAIRAVATRTGPPIRILDVATGGGDVPLAISRRAVAAGLGIELHACDVSGVALEHARSAAGRARLILECFEHDILARDLPGEFDVVTCSLFLHHLDPPDAILALRRMSTAARRLLLVSDLRRTRMGMALAWGASRLITASTVVRTDAVLSVHGAYTTEEMRQLADRAGLTNATVARAWPQRMLLKWSRRNA